MAGYIPLEHFKTTDDDLSSVRIRDMPFGKRRESLYITPTLINFNEIAINESSPPYTILVVNDGYDIVIINSIEIVGDFISTFPEISVINPGQIIPLEVIFSPKRSGTLTGGIYIDSGDAAGPEFIKLSGFGIEEIEEILSLPNLPIYSDNATAIAANQAVGNVYRTATGELRIVI